MMAEFFSLFGPTLRVFGFIFRFWWIWSGPLLIFFFIETWLSWRQQLYKNAITWVLLELHVPREVRKSPKAMEQFLAALYHVRNIPGDFMEKYADGEVTLWFSLEVISMGGEIRLFLRTPAKHKQIVMSNLYANYPMVEIEEVPDYVDTFPPTLGGLYEKGFNLWGSELVLGKNDVYPIRTYLQFEAIEEEKSLDPIASLLEVFRNLKRQENVWLQMLIRPADPAWKERGDALVKELKNKDMKMRPSAFGEYEDRPTRTPGEIEVMKAVEQNISKSGFETLIRYVYIADMSAYDINFAKRGTLSAFNQYSAQNLNHFLHNYSIYTQTKWVNFPYFFPHRRAQGRKERIYRNFRERKMPEETLISKYLFMNPFNTNFRQRVFILNTEELATLYHLPTTLVLTAPLMKRVESKRMGPPMSMPIFEEDKDKRE